MNPIKKIFGVEWRHIFALPIRTRALLTSFSLREAAGPLMDIFVNAFLWRTHQDAVIVAIYNIGVFVGLPLGFILNGTFLRDRLKAAHLYFAGAFLKGLTIGILVFVSPSSLPAIFLGGLIFGLASGIYWANRNFITVEYIQDNTSNYFFGLSGAISSVTGVVVPAAAGWFIAAGLDSGLYTPDTAYRVLMVVTLTLLFLAGRVIYKKDFPVPKVKAIFVRKADRLWSGVRGTALLIGFLTGANGFISVIMILTFIGDEGALGAIRATVAFGTAIVLYSIGRLISPQGRVKVMGWGVAVLLAAAAIFAAMGTLATALIFVLASGFGLALIVAGYSPFVIFATEKDTEGHRALHYARVVDHEIFLNTGRIAGAGLFVLLLLYLPLTASMRIVLPIIMFMQIGLVLLVRSLIQMTGAKPAHPGLEAKPGEHVLAKVRKTAAEN